MGVDENVQSEKEGNFIKVIGVKRGVKVTIVRSRRK